MTGKTYGMVDPSGGGTEAAVFLDIRHDRHLLVCQCLHFARLWPDSYHLFQLWQGPGKSDRVVHRCSDYRPEGRLLSHLRPDPKFEFFSTICDKAALFSQTLTVWPRPGTVKKGILSRLCTRIKRLVLPFGGAISIERTTSNRGEYCNYGRCSSAVPS